MFSSLWRILRLAVPLLLLAVVLAYVVTGYLVKSRVQQAIDRYNEEAVGYQLVVDDYSQGFKSSNFKLGIASEVQPMMAMVKAQVDVDHGPWPLRIASLSHSLLPKLAAARIHLPMLAMIHPDLEEAHFSLEMGVGGNLHFSSAIPSFEQMLPAEGQTIIFSFFGLDGQADAHQETQSVKGQLVGGGFSLRMNSQVLLWGDTDYQFDLHDSFSLPTGTASMTLSELTFDTGHDKIGVHQVISNGSTDDDQGLLQSTGTTRIRQLQVGRQKFGPADIRLSSGGVHRQAIADMQEVLHQPDATPETIAPALNEILKHKPFIQIDRLKVQGEQGDAELTGRMQVLPFTSSLPPENPLPLLDGAFEFSCERSFMETLWGYGLEISLREDNYKFNMQTPDAELRKQAVLYAKIQLKDLVKQGWLKKVDDRYQAKLVVADGQVRINGKAVPF